MKKIEDQVLTETQRSEFDHSPKFELTDLLTGITAENQHPEIGFGAAVGKEIL